MARMSLEKPVRIDSTKSSPNAYINKAKTIEIEFLRFQDKDLYLVGTLEYGQFGVVSGLHV